MTASVVICAYTDERWDDITAAIQSVLAQTPPPAEVLLVVDHCDMLLARARQAFAEVRVLANTGAKGLSSARNVGFQAASSDVVAFLDDDAQAAPGWLALLLDGYRDNNVVGVGGSVRPHWVTGRPRWFPAEFDWVVGCSHSGMPDRRADVRNFVGANMSMRRSSLVQLRGFSDHLGRRGAGVAGCEETELCIRAGALTSTSRLVYEPSALVIHNVPAHRATLSYFLRRCYGEGKSKAMVRHLAGSATALSSERAYLSTTIPVGIGRALKGTTRGDPCEIWRACALLVGVGATFAGYLFGRTGDPAVRSRAFNENGGRK
ncbi:MAG: glycosyltransferase [Actinomycetota bacterium]|nr:glycosyltransferase [Actinomycetota bacterium]